MLTSTIEAKHGVARAREARKHLSRLFGFAMEEALIKVNPMAGWRRKDLKSVARTRHLSDAELRAAWTATGLLPYPYGAFRLLLLTGQRLREWLHGTWPAIDARDKVLTVPENESGVSHIVPLCDATWEIVESLPRYNSTDNLFVTNRTKNKGDDKKNETLAIADSSSDAVDEMNRLALLALREATGNPKATLERFTPHDFRRTMDTRMKKLRVAFDVSEAVLGHVKKGTAKNYNMYEYLDEKREALALYAAHVIQVTA